MHYDSLAFSRNGRETLVAIEPEMTKVMGSATDFSQADLAKIRGMYQCIDSETSTDEFTGKDNSIASESFLPLWHSSFQTNWFSPYVMPRLLTVTAGTPTRQTKPILFQNNLENGELIGQQQFSNRLPQCPFWAPYCNFPFYGRLLHQLCPETCGSFQKSPLSYSSLRMQNLLSTVLNKKKKRR